MSLNNVSAFRDGHQQTETRKINKPDGSTFTTQELVDIDEPSKTGSSELTQRGLSRNPAGPALRNFLRENASVSLAVAAGAMSCFAVIAYSQWLSKQILACPAWAVDCDIPDFVALNANNIAIVQGLASIAYSIGLAAMAYGAKCLSESALWPLLSKQYFSLAQLETYLWAARGSIPSTVVSWRLIRTRSAALILFLSAVTTITPLSAAPLVGYVYARLDIDTQFESKYIPGGGSGRIFVQQNPPIFVGDNQQASYVSWANKQSPEPLPEHRLWMFDRSSLQFRGGLTANAVRADSNISCQPFSLNQTGPLEDDYVSFSTNMASHNQAWRWLNSSDHARIRLGQAVAVWVHDFTFHHPNKTSAVVVFAAFNATVENGSETIISQGWKVSSIACDIAVELVDDVLVIGNGGPTNTTRSTLSSIQTIKAPSKSRNSTGPVTLNENVLLFAVAPMLVGMSVEGSQPLYYAWNNNTLPSAYIRAPFVDGEDTFTWSEDFIKNFINVSMGTVAQAAIWIDMQTANETVLVTLATSQKLVPGRAGYLAIPMGMILLGEIILLFWNLRMHAMENLPSMRLAGVCEILESSQTRCICDNMDRDVGTPALKALERLRVKFGWAESPKHQQAVAGLSRVVVPFKLADRHGNRHGA